MISATQAYNYIHCPHRVAQDIHCDPSRRDEANEFLELLWRHGVVHEAEAVATLNITADFTDLTPESREQETRAAMLRGEPLIYHGRLTVGDRVGEPDLLRRVAGGYQPGDIKSGSGFDGEEEAGKLKKTYAIQVAHNYDMLVELGLSDGTGDAFIVDGSGVEVAYPLRAPQGVRNENTWMDLYHGVLNGVRATVAGTVQTRPALGATCKLCHWYSSCRQAVVEANDLSLIAELGRSKRDTLSRLIPTVADLAAANLENFSAGRKTVFPGIGPDSLKKFQDRAVLLSTPGAEPYLKLPVSLPVTEKEIYFDLEADPMRGGNFVYLHGLVERDFGRPETAQFRPTITLDITPEAEEEAFRQSWLYLFEHVEKADAAIYYYSPYERTAYKALASRYPSVCSVADVELLFDQPLVIDLYTSVIKKATEWPTYDQSIKTLAKWLGFNWRDAHPSGAASIQWFDEWVRSRDPAKLQRILDYNEDDCLATGVVVDGVRKLKLKVGQTLAMAA